MPTVLSHGIVAAALGKTFQRDRVPLRFWAAGIACAVVPDLDVIGFRVGIPYGAVLGHRGLSHSLMFALVLGTLATVAVFPNGLPGMRPTAIWLYLSLAAASHGLIDAFTNGGLGIALLAPFDNTRYFAPWRPIQVSPIGIRPLLSREGIEVLLSEAEWVWLPALMLVIFGRLWRRESNVLTGTGSERSAR
jgi:inner membrane protein